MKIWRILTVAAARAVLAAGCESFRDDYDADKAKTRADERRKNKRSAKKGKSKRSRDPRDDMFFGLGGAKAESFAKDKLNPGEQKLFEDELRRQDEEMRDLRRMHREMDSGRSKRKEWVYGFKPLGSDK